MLWNWRIEAQPGSPEYNMAEDAALLRALADGSELQPTIRVYTWDRKAVSIGRLQREESVREYYPGLPLVRRPTGGRAVLHGDDLTVAAALRLDHLPLESRSVLKSYRLLASGVKAALCAIGLNAVHGTESAVGQHQVVDCFALSAGCDLVDERTGRKLVGSAQRRAGAALLQQMSIPLRVISNQSAFLAHLRESFAARRFVDL